MKRWEIALAVVGLSLAACLVLRAQQQSANATQSSAKDTSRQIHTIQLPDNAGEILPGPHVEVYTKDCLLCHSARYVSMQPGFSREVWQSEVKKMVNAYGASIPESEQVLIVDYLVAVRGPQVSASKPAK